MDAYTGEVRMFGGQREPNNFMFCQGQLLDINQYRDLYNVIGTTYGGDGVNNFKLPDMQGRIPVHRGSGFAIGQMGGSETHALQTAELPSHNHLVRCATDDATSGAPAGNILAHQPGEAAFLFYQSTPGDGMNQNMIAMSTGTDGPHDNIQPFLCFNYIICMSGFTAPATKG